MRSAILLLHLLLFSHLAHAEKLQICHAYDCSEQSTVEFPPKKLAELKALFKRPRNADEERDTVSRAVAAMYVYAGTQSPIWQDHAGNDDDEEMPGRMDCIDHSTNTTTFLLLMQKQGWLRFHTVGRPIRRNIWNAHWAVDLIERGSGERYVVDSWFFEPGEPAAVFALDNWLGGAKPSLTKAAGWQ
ncbi:MAG TPA: hypothetical protein VJU83_02130 [Burkholderiales bacterium]|nr:hypothetical protein [Burkholderiales bacterium]